MASGIPSRVRLPVLEAAVYCLIGLASLLISGPAFVGDVLATASRSLLALCIATVVGVGLTLVVSCGRGQRFGLVFDAMGSGILICSGMLASLPLLLLSATLHGSHTSGTAVAVRLGFAFAFFPIFVTLWHGLSHARGSFGDLVASAGAGWLRSWRHVWAGALTHRALLALRIGWVSAILGVTIAEFGGGSRSVGLGARLAGSLHNLEQIALLAIAALLIAISGIGFSLVSFFVRLAGTDASERAVPTGVARSASGDRTAWQAAVHIFLTLVVAGLIWEWVAPLVIGTESFTVRKIGHWVLGNAERASVVSDAMLALAHSGLVVLVPALLVSGIIAVSMIAAHEIHRAVSGTAEAVLIGTQVVPMVAWLSVVVAIFGHSDLAVVTVACSVLMYRLAEAVKTAVLPLRSRYIEIARVYSTSRVAHFRFITVPLLWRNLFPAMLGSLPLLFQALLLGEFYVTGSRTGAVIREHFYRPDAIAAIALVMAFVPAIGVYASSRLAFAPARR